MKITTCEIFERDKLAAPARADNETFSRKAHS
jgi:hypothetical protein